MIKKLIYILILLMINANLALAEVQSGVIEENFYGYSFTQGDYKYFLQKANENMKMFEDSLIAGIKNEHYLNEAMKYYFLLSKINENSIDAEIGLGRVYDALNKDRLAKKHFFKAYNIDTKNPRMNFYFGNYYYKRNDFIKALSYYKKVYHSGVGHDYSFYYRMGNLYEKLADIEHAKEFYQKALNINPKDTVLIKKIRLLDELNYSESQYYLFNK